MLIHQEVRHFELSRSELNGLKWKHFVMYTFDSMNRIVEFFAPNFSVKFLRVTC